MPHHGKPKHGIGGKHGGIIGGGHGRGRGHGGGLGGGHG